MKQEERTERILALIARISHHILREGYSKNVGDEYSVSVCTELIFDDDAEFEAIKEELYGRLDDDAEFDSEYYRVVGYRDMEWVKKYVFYDLFQVEVHPISVNGNPATRIDIHVKISIEYTYAKCPGMLCWQSISEKEFTKVLANHCIGGPYDSWVYWSPDESYWPKEAENLPDEGEE